VGTEVAFPDDFSGKGDYTSGKGEGRGLPRSFGKAFCFYIWLMMKDVATIRSKVIAKTTNAGSSLHRPKKV